MTYLAAALHQAFNDAVARGHDLCLLLDSSQAEGSHRLLDKWRVGFRSLFAGTPEESLIEIAPLLIPTAELALDIRDTLFSWAARLAYTAPCLSWFETNRSSQEQAEHLRLYHVVGLNEGQSMLMRWYDTRILPVWLACLTPAQVADFTAGTMRWHCVDRFGQVCALPSETGAGEPPSPPALGAPLVTLTDTQYGMLVDAADLDILLGHLRRIIPDELGLVPQRTLTAFVARHQQAARQAGLDGIDRQTQYVLLALYTSGKGVEQPEFKAFMKSPPATLKAFSEKLQALSDAVWNAGPPLWASVPGATAETATTNA